MTALIADLKVLVPLGNRIVAHYLELGRQRPLTASEKADLGPVLDAQLRIRAELEMLLAPDEPSGVRAVLRDVHYEGKA